MERRNEYDGLDPEVVQVIRIKARRLVGVAGVLPADIPDIEQEFVIKVRQALARFDAARASLRTFATRVVDNQAATLIAARKAAVRNFEKEAGSLDELDQEPADTPRFLGARTSLAKLLPKARRDDEVIALRADLDRVVATLPPEDRELCERLKTSTVSDISQETGVPRGTIYERITRIRDRFQRAGLAVYLLSDSFRGRPVSNPTGHGDARSRRRGRTS